MITRTDDKVMNKAVLLLKKMSADDKLREIARIRERALHDEASYIADATEKGIAIGMEKGMEKGIEKGIKKGRAESAADIWAILQSLGTDEELLKRAQTEYANKD